MGLPALLRESSSLSMAPERPLFPHETFWVQSGTATGTCQPFVPKKYKKALALKFHFFDFHKHFFSHFFFIGHVFVFVQLIPSSCADGAALAQPA